MLNWKYAIYFRRLFSCRTANNLRVIFSENSQLGVPSQRFVNIDRWNHEISRIQQTKVHRFTFERRLKIECDNSILLTKKRLLRWMIDISTIYIISDLWMNTFVVPSKSSAWKVQWGIHQSLWCVFLLLLNILQLI